MSSESENELVIMGLLNTPGNRISSSESSSSLDSSFADSDESGPRRKRSRIENYVEKTVKEYDDNEFKSHFRISRKTTYNIIGLFQQSKFHPMYSAGRPNVSVEKTILLSLWYLSNRNSFREVSDRFGVGLSTAHNCLNRSPNFLISVRNDFIVWPNEQQNFSCPNPFRKTMEFSKKTRIHIYNRKGYHSMLLQGVVDDNKKFIDVFCGESGSLHNARLLRRSALYGKILRDPNFIGDFFLLGDSAYPNLAWIVTPFADTEFLTEEQKLFNKRLSSKRVIVENAFGLLKGRFRRLRGLENFDYELCSKIILGSCILHNICLDDTMNILEDIGEYDGNQPLEVPLHTVHGGRAEVQENIIKRQEVFNKMFNL